ncbi:MAG: glycerol-3-phosphate 1-O-acyltransferase PlsY [Candidatus Kaelpia aquatica]|nr:glycerol-3-phosphate 1-O-acyltransferase PlsY [Candidatus Kaelpia aquatica]
MREAVFIFFAYIVGGVPFAYIISRVFSRVDIRKRGSGNVGATNVLRVVGPIAGVLVLLLDILKGFLVVKLAPQSIIYVAGLAVIVGHCWTPFLRFKGGKGVATTLGVLLGINPIFCLFAASSWIVVFSIFKIVSLSSISAILILPIILLIRGEQPFLLSFITIYSALIIFRHQANLIRLIRGEEKRIKFKKSCK